MSRYKNGRAMNAIQTLDVAVFMLIASGGLCVVGP
jgi:hypothetical protein